VLKQGSHGCITRAVQEALVRNGHNIDADGHYGLGTEAAVIEGQANAVGIRPAGKCGPDTFAAVWGEVALAR
jgi:peptidoglycan hydrolase-like protein with peptidoglycan-binding domain